MSLESVYFKRDYHYKAKFVNKCIAIIRFTKSEKRRRAYHNLVFKMMKDIVKKNIANYLNLLSSINMKDTLPSRDELIADCWAKVTISISISTSLYQETFSEIIKKSYNAVIRQK